MNAHLYLVVSEHRPDLSDDDEDILVLPEDVDPEALPVEDLRFMTTVFINTQDPSSILVQFREWWAENGGGEVQLDLLADDESCIAPDRIAEVSDLEDDSWSVRAAFLVYPSTSDESYQEARNLIIEAELQQN